MPGTDGPALPNHADLAAWAASVGLPTTEALADVLCLTGQTLRNWSREPLAALPPWTALAMAGYDAWLAGPLREQSPRFPDLGPSWFRAWANDRGMATYEAQGRPFGQSRQTVCKWMTSGLPGWLPIACIGVDARSGAGRAAVPG